MEENRTFVNTPMDEDLLKKLDEMVEQNESTRAQFIRLLIRQKWEVEYQTPEETKRKTNPRMRAIAA